MPILLSLVLALLLSWYGGSAIKEHAPVFYGGAALLAYEHVWHGEVVPWFPFLTAAANPEDAAVMLHEMATVGVTMALLVTAAWGCIALAADKIVKRESGVEPAVR